MHLAVRCALIVAVAARSSHGAPAARALLPTPAHLDAFQAAWREARACLVGDPVLAPDLAEAYALQRPADGACAPPLDRAAAVVDASDADPGYHVAWRMIGLGLTWLRERDVAGGIRQVDIAEAELRAWAGAPAVVAPRVLVPREVGAPALAGTKGLDLRITGAIHDHVVALTDRDTTLIAYGPTRVARVDRSASGEQRARWRAEARANGTAVVAIPLDADAAPITDGAVVMRGAGLTIATTMGDDRDRAIVVHAPVPDGEEGLAWIARSHDGGATWDAPVALADGRPAMIVRGADRVELFWANDAGGVTWERLVDPIAAPRRGALAGPVDPRSMCGAGALLWLPDWGTGHVFVSDAAGEHDQGDPGPAWVRACADRAIALDQSGAVVVCTSDGCASPRPVPADAFLELGPHDQVVTAIQRGTHAIVTIGARRQVMRVGRAEVVAVVTWGERVYLGLVTAEGLAFAPVPEDGP